MCPGQGPSAGRAVESSLRAYQRHILSCPDYEDVWHTFWNKLPAPTLHGNTDTYLLQQIPMLT